MYERRSAEMDEPEWVYWLDRKQIDVMAGRCLIELGDPATAEPLLSGAIAAYTPEHAARSPCIRRGSPSPTLGRASWTPPATRSIAHARQRGV